MSMRMTASLHPFAASLIPPGLLAVEQISLDFSFDRNGEMLSPEGTPEACPNVAQRATLGKWNMKTPI